MRNFQKKVKKFLQTSGKQHVASLLKLRKLVSATAARESAAVVAECGIGGQPYKCCISPQLCKIKKS